MGQKFEDDFDVMFDSLGAKGLVKGLLDAREYWTANKGKEKDGERATEITVKKWKEMIVEEHGPEDEDDEDIEEEDDDANEDEEEEDAGEDEDEPEEPPVKKSK